MIVPKAQTPSRVGMERNGYQDKSGETVALGKAGRKSFVVPPLGGTKLLPAKASRYQDLQIALN